MSSSTWKTLTDAATGKLYYYNTVTQATQWEMPSELQQSAPTEAPTPPTSPSVPQAGVDVWYELYHHSYGRCYYYNKQTGQTCWERPTTGTVQVFNQTESLQAPSPTSAPRHPVAALFAHSVQQPDSPQAIRPSSASHLPVARPGDSSRGLSGEANRSFGDHPNHPHLAGQLAPGWEEYNDQQSGKKYYVHRASGKTTWNRAEAVSTPANLSSPQLETRQISSVSSPSTSFPSPAVSQSSVRSTVGSLPSLTQTPQKQAVGHLSVNGPIDPATIYSDAGHSLPKMLIVDIHKFQETDFARKHFMERKKGFFRRTVTKYEIMTFSKEVVDKSILRVSRHLEKLAIRCFKKIMKFMGDYRCKNQDREGMMLITFGTDHFELRDEIFCQLAKQITENPSEESNIRGWGLFGLCLSCFQPSPALTDHLKEILDAHAHGKNEKVATFAKFCLARIGRKDMPEKRNFTHTDIHRCPELPWKPNYFNCSIAELLDYQGDNGKPDAVPKFLVALIDGVLKYNGTQTEGIFRIAANTEIVDEIKKKLMLGDCDLSHVTDPHVYAVLMKQWLRALVIPLVPPELYPACLAVCRDPVGSVEVLNRFPAEHKSTMIYIIRFLKKLAQPENQKITKMDFRNLAVVLSPNILRCQETDPQMVFTKSQEEAHFFQTLIENHPC